MRVFIGQKLIIHQPTQMLPSKMNFCEPTMKLKWNDIVANLGDCYIACSVLEFLTLGWRNQMSTNKPLQIIDLQRFLSFGGKLLAIVWYSPFGKQLIKFGQENFTVFQFH